MKSTQIVKIDPKDTDFNQIRDLAVESRKGRLIAFPTETVYGIGAPMSIPGIVESLIALKERTPDKPFSFHIGSLEMLNFLNVRRTPIFRYLAKLFWPGPVTLIAEDEEGGKVGLRFPNNRLSMALINAVGEPFVATSANKSGEPAATTADEVMEKFEGHLDFVVDGGTSEEEKDSTVIDLTQIEPTVLRPGAMIKEVEEAIQKIKQGKYIRKRVLVVCTGNSCRSPMAEGLIIDELEKKGFGEQIEVSSCGVGARMGARATQEAIFVMQNQEIDISEHRSRPITREDVLESDLIIAMSQEHSHFISGLIPDSKDKIKVLNVLDPIGMPMPVYQGVFEDIQKKIVEIWDEIVA